MTEGFGEIKNLPFQKNGFKNHVFRKKEGHRKKNSFRRTRPKIFVRCDFVFLSWNSALTFLDHAFSPLLDVWLRHCYCYKATGSPRFLVAQTEISQINYSISCSRWCQSFAFLQILSAVTYSCKCQPRYHGKHCETFTSRCGVVDDCLNGGVCVTNAHYELSCQCMLGFTGSACEQGQDFVLYRCKSDIIW